MLHCNQNPRVEGLLSKKFYNIFPFEAVLTHFKRYYRITYKTSYILRYETLINRFQKETTLLITTF